MYRGIEPLRHRSAPERFWTGVKAMQKYLEAGKVNPRCHRQIGFSFGRHGKTGAHCGTEKLPRQALGRRGRPRFARTGKRGGRGSRLCQRAKLRRTLLQQIRLFGIRRRIFRRTHSPPRYGIILLKQKTDLAENICKVGFLIQTSFMQALRIETPPLRRRFHRRSPTSAPSLAYAKRGFHPVPTK